MGLFGFFNKSSFKEEKPSSHSEDHAAHKTEAEKRILEDVEKYGCHLALFEADHNLPAFVYSIGLFKNFGHPEIICFGLKVNVMAGIINEVRDRVSEGEVFTSGTSYAGFLEGYDIQFLDVHKAYYPDYLGYAGWFYNNTFDFPTLQLVWPDKEHHFPWEAEFNPNWKFKQLMLDRNADFRFYEERNLGVFTTKQALNGDPILYVYHDEDGEWQFHTSESPSLSDTILVCLEDILKLDPSINELYHLSPGWRAWRKSVNDRWETEAYE
jgi:Domain of unknown function (DUF4262)